MTARLYCSGVKLSFQVGTRSIRRSRYRNAGWMARPHHDQKVLSLLFGGTVYCRSMQAAVSTGPSPLGGAPRNVAAQSSCETAQRARLSANGKLW